jgi:hypothetical protein
MPRVTATCESTGRAWYTTSEYRKPGPEGPIVRKEPRQMTFPKGFR